MESRQSTGVEQIADSLEKPLLDNRTYRVVKLANELEALLIHDADTDKASAALDNHAGAMSDAKDMPGMAHAVEHLLFMGTKKYPEENEYSRYLSAHSGHSNAFTASTSTNYFFEVAAEDEEKSSNATETSKSYPTSPLYGALDRFAQFFVSPLFLEETLERELRAVDSENKKNLQSDQWRMMQLGRTLCNPKHPNNHFATGNLKTLKDDPLARGVKIRDEFMNFHDKQYSANRMKLVVLGRESLDTLQSWVEELFSDVVNKNLPENRWDGIPIYSENELLDEIRAKPVMDTRSLTISFPWLDEDELYEEQPGRYLSHLIGHEGPGSILSYLKAKGWANELSSGDHTISPGTGIFDIQLKLTPDGLVNYKEIIKVVFQYISIIKETSPQKWIFDEIKRMTEVDFRFKQKSDASRTTSRLSQVMQKPLPRDRLLSGENVLTRFDGDLIKKAMSQFEPDNFRIMIVAPDAVEGRDIQHEPWYNTEYTISKLPEEFLSEVRQAYNSTSGQRISELSLPAKNEFIPSNLEVEKKETSQPMKTPKLIRNEKNLRLWYKKDDQFWVPKGTVNVLLRNPICGSTARDAVLGAVYTELVEDSLSEFTYDADIAGLHYRVDNPTNGLIVQVSGYSDKMSVLLKKVLTSMKNLEIKQDRFDVIKERMSRGWKNSEFQPPYHQISTFARWLAVDNAFTTQDYIEELPAITSDDVRKFQAVLLGQFHIEALVHGNVYQEDTLKMADVIENTLKPAVFPPEQWSIRRAIDFPAGSNYIYERPLQDPAQVNHAIFYSLNIGLKTDPQLHAQLLLLCQMLQEPAFNQLRTIEQLGYVVFSGHVVHATNEAFRVLIQSERTPEHLEARIEHFLTTFRTTLADMPNSEFESHKGSVVSERLERLKNLGEEGSRFWHHISSEIYHFQQRETDAAVLRTLSKADMLAFYDRFISPASATRAKLSVYLRAKAGAVVDAVAGATGEEQKAKFLGALEQYLSTQGMPVETSALAARFKDVDVGKGAANQDAILAAFTAYLQHDAGLPEQVVAGAVEQGKPLLEAVLAKVSAGAADEGSADGKSASAEGSEEGKKAVMIKDVRTFKASLPLTIGAAPISELSVFEELGSKL